MRKKRIKGQWHVDVIEQGPAIAMVQLRVIPHMIIFCQNNKAQYHIKAFCFENKFKFPVRLHHHAFVFVCVQHTHIHTHHCLCFCLILLYNGKMKENIIKKCLYIPMNQFCSNNNNKKVLDCLREYILMSYTSSCVVPCHVYT